MKRLVVLLLLAGCTAPTGRTADQAPRTADLNPVPRAGIKDGGTLRWPLPELPGQWNFHQVNGMSGSVDAVLRGLLPYPTGTDAAGGLRIDHDYLESAQVIATRPRQVVRYRLNPKSRWSTGGPITYLDFAAQAEALSGKTEGFRLAADTGYRQILKVTRGKGPYEVLVTFAQPFADWGSLFSPLYPAATNTTAARFNVGWQRRIPVTAGPFKVRKLDQAAQTVTIERDPAWWGRPAKLDSIEFRALDQAAQAGAFANREVDLMDVGTDPGAYQRASAVEGALIRRAAGPDWRHITMNAGGGALADIRVRQAVALAIDREMLAKASLQDLGWPVQTLDNHFFMNGQTGYQDNTGGLGRPDVARARRLLKAAGIDRLKLRFVIPAGSPAARDEAELLGRMLAEIGVELEPRPVPQQEVISGHVIPGDFDLVAFSWLGTPYPASSMRSVFARPEGDDLQQNFARTGTARIDELLDRASRELDPDTARKLINQADALIWQQAAVLPLYQRPQLVAVQRGLANFGARGLRDLAYEDIGFTAAAPALRSGRE